MLDDRAWTCASRRTSTRASTATTTSRRSGFKVGYKFRRWLTFGAEYTYTQRDSNLPSFEYDKNLYLLTATASM